VAGKHGKFLLIGYFPQEPTRLRRLHDELESAVSEGSQSDFEGHIAANVARHFVELFAELHHVDTQGAKRLPHLGVGLSDSGEYSQIDLGCLMRCVPRYDIALINYDKLMSKGNRQSAGKETEYFIIISRLNPRKVIICCIEQ